MKKKEIKEKRRKLVEQTKKLILKDHYLQYYDDNGKKPFQTATLEDGCNTLIMDPIYPTLADTLPFSE